MELWAKVVFLVLCSLWLPILSAAKFSSKFPAAIVGAEKLSLSPENTPYKTEYYTQILDHFDFNPESYETFQQRYLINDTYWGGAGSNSPIFVYTGNEGDIEWFAQNTGFLYETAPSFKALIVFVEHRFYGKSMPYGGDKEIAYSNSTTLGCLSSTQALADYATLVTDLQKNLSATDSPVIVFGGSYGGMLAAWFRLKYPHIAIGALASSSPILHFENITSPYVFSDIVSHDFRSESESCYKVIKGSWDYIDEVAAQPHGLERLRSSFHICKNYISASSLEGWLSTAFVYTAMTDYPTPSNFLNPLPAYPVKQMCKAIDDPTTGNDTLAKLYGAASVFYNYSGVEKCFDLADDSDPHGLGGWTWQPKTHFTGWGGELNIYTAQILFSQTMWDCATPLISAEPSQTIAYWVVFIFTWQACTEMIMPTGGNNKDSIFPESKWNYESRVSFCKQLFKIEPRRNWIVTEFGGKNIERVLKRFGSNIIFFNGLRDPWSGGGVVKNISSSIVAIVAEQGAHHVDLRFSTKEDPEWLQDVRRREIRIINEWLLQYYHDLIRTK